MKRYHYETEEMVREIKALRKQGVDHIMCHVQKPDGVWIKPQIKQTAQGISSYCNRMYQKYGDGTKIEVIYFIFEDSRLEQKTYCTYG